MTLSGNQTLQQINQVEISYVDKITGETVVVSEADNPFSDEGERKHLADTATDGSVYFLYNLISDTEYTLKAKATLTSGRTSYIEETYKTLKATPVVTSTRFDVNSERFFISKATLEKDEDNALRYFDHEIYRYYSASDLTGDCLKKKTTTEPESYIYLDNKGIFAGKDSLDAYYEYGNRIYMTWYDNEKYVTQEVGRAASWHAQHIADSNSSYIELRDDTIKANEMSAKLVISPGTNKAIYVGDKDVHRILVQITSSGYTKVLYYSSLDEWYNMDGKDLKGKTSLTQRAYLPLNLTGLAANTTYSITVTAYFDSHSSVSKTVGSTVFKTTSN